MDNYENELRDKWNKINYREGGALQLSVDHPLEWFVRYETPEQKSVVALCDKPAVNLPPSRSIDTSYRKRKDGKYAISFTLIEQEREDVFIAMAADIIQYSQATDSDKALKLLIKRYNEWRQLLDQKHSALLSVEAQKGLIGELLYLKEQIEHGMQPDDAVSGWVGPENADKDFTYSDGWHEIKTTGISSSYVTISSIEQLDSNESGELVIFRADKCAPEEPGSITLYQLVHNIYDLLSSFSNTVDNFTLKLQSVGYIDIKEYDKQYFIISDERKYIVDDTFPCLCRGGMPVEIVNAQYQINLPSIKQWMK